MKFLKTIFGHSLSRLIMPSQSHTAGVFGKASSFPKNTKFNVSEATIDSTGGARINLCEIVTKPIKVKNKKNDKVIIHGVGNGDIYETHFAQFIEEATKTYPGCRIVGFNFRNVQYSTGRANCEDDWVDDTVAVIEHYQKKGIPLKNIVLNGHSLGGAILTMAAARIVEKERLKAPANPASVKLMNNRSFSNLTEEVLQSILGGIGSGLVIGLLMSVGLFAGFGFTSMGLVTSLLAIKANVVLGFCLPKVSQFILRPLLDGILVLTFGRMDALKAYKMLPEDSKDHIMARDDRVIVPKASLHAGLKPINSALKKSLREKITIAEVALEQTKKRATRKNQVAIIQDLKDKLLNLKDSKIRLHDNNLLSSDAHNEPLWYLHTYHKFRSQNNKALPKQVSGEEVMQRKIKRFFGGKL